MSRKNTVELSAERYAELQARNKAARNPVLPRDWGVVKGDTAPEPPKPRQSKPEQHTAHFQGVFTIDLPWPPSVNTYWRHPSTGKLAGRHLISEKGREYRKAVIEVANREIFNTLTGRLTVRLDCYPPDRRRRDLDNLPKSILDALQHAGIIADDGNIDDLRIVRHEIGQIGMVRVSITES